MLAFSSVPPVSVLAPAGSAQPLGKVNANAGWLAHMPHSISVSLAFSLFSYMWGCFFFFFFIYISYLSHSECEGEAFWYYISSCFPLEGKQRSEKPHWSTFWLAQGHFRRAERESVLTQRFEPHSSIWRASLNLRSPSVIRRIHYFCRFPVFLPH